jgi:hypothetical protein
MGKKRRYTTERRTYPGYLSGDEHEREQGRAKRMVEGFVRARHEKEKDFFNNVLEGNQIKEVVKVMLEKSGYLVLPYGYESTFSGLRRRLGEKGTRKTRTVRRIRASPDLLVYDSEKKDLMLVEIKMRNAPNETKILIYSSLIANYKEFWNDSVLVIVVPCGNIFYAQSVGELEVKEEYDATREFEKFEDVFARVKEEDISHFKTKALQIIKTSKS